MFEFRVHEEPSIVNQKRDFETSRQLLSSSRENSQTDDDRELSVSECNRYDPVEVEARRRTLLALSPENFEHLVKDVLVGSGFDRVTVTSFQQDGGVDVNAMSGASMWPINELLIQVQAKRWLHTVGRREVAELRGSLQPFARGALVTTSHFSKAAITEAAAPGKSPIVLVDGYLFSTITMAMPHLASIV